MAQLSIGLVACINIYVFKGEYSVSRWIDGAHDVPYVGRARYLDGRGNVGSGWVVIDSKGVIVTVDQYSFAVEVGGFFDERIPEVDETRRDNTVKINIGLNDDHDTGCLLRLRHLERLDDPLVCALVAVFVFGLGLVAGRVANGGERIGAAIVVQGIITANHMCQLGYPSRECMKKILLGHKVSIDTQTKNPHVGTDC